MSIRDFEVGKELGKGAFGSVFIVKRKEDSNIYAMKRVKISQLNTKERENALNEVRILASLNHQNIVGYKEAFFEEDSRTLNIVMEYADDGDLESKIQKCIKTKVPFTESEIWSCLIQIIQGLKYLHENKVMHRDLKCANIFLLKNGTVKLGDLNVSKIVKMGMCSTQTGTPYYASPEVWADKPYDYKSDIWSVGCIIYELCTLKPPFRGSNLDQLFKSVTKGKKIKLKLKN
jgi:NIMA (never in mitosis gene a)-related kinase